MKSSGPREFNYAYAQETTIVVNGQAVLRGLNPRGYRSVRLPEAITCRIAAKQLIQTVKPGGVWLTRCLGPRREWWYCETGDARSEHPRRCQVAGGWRTGLGKGWVKGAGNRVWHIFPGSSVQLPAHRPDWPGRPAGRWGGERSGSEDRSQSRTIRAHSRRSTRRWHARELHLSAFGQRRKCPKSVRPERAGDFLVHRYIWQRDGLRHRVVVCWTQQITIGTRRRSARS